MIRINGFADHAQQADEVLSLPYELRQKSRLRTQLDSGQDAGLSLPRGTILRGGDLLLSDDGLVIEVRARRELTSNVVSENKRLLMCAAYHLGNRHVTLQVTDKGLRYLKDHVLDKMIEQLGLEVTHEVVIFEPESGAYGGHSHANE